MASSRKAKRQRPAPAFTSCPNCGESFRAGRLACPECGSDAETGWRESEDIDLLAVDLPEPEVDEPVVAAKQMGLPRGLIVVTGIILVIALVLVFVLGAR